VFARDEMIVRARDRHMNSMKNRLWASRWALRTCLVAATLATAACAEGSVGAPSPSVGNQPVTVDVFSGTLPLLASRFFSFTATQSGTASIVLLALKENGVDSTATVSIGLGVPRATECFAGTPVTVGVGTAPQVAIGVEPLVYCAVITDVGNLKAPAEFSINIIRPR
jgi:hypothetical protein